MYAALGYMIVTDVVTRKRKEGRGGEGRKEGGKEGRKEGRKEGPQFTDRSVYSNSILLMLTLYDSDAALYK
jgi:hypothetical protein